MKRIISDIAVTDILTKYDANKDVYDSFAMSLKSLLNTLIRDAGYSIHSLDARVKTRASLNGKVLRKGKYDCIEDITDVVGVRVITHYSDDVDKLARLIESEFSIDRENSIDKRITIEPDRFGYLSLHYVVSLTDNRTSLKEYASYKNIKAEIQIRSILQHAWAEIEHDIGYKSVNGLPNEIKRYFSRLAGLLEIADDEFIKIKESIIAREKEIAEVLESGAGEDTLDLVSLREYIDKSKILNQVAHDFSSKHSIPIIRGKTTRQLDSILNGLYVVGVTTIKELDKAFTENKDIVINRVNSFSSEFFEDFRISGMPKEILVSYLSQILVARQNSSILEDDFYKATKLRIVNSRKRSFFEDIREVISSLTEK